MLGNDIREPYATIPVEPSGMSMVLLLSAEGTGKQERHSTDKQTEKRDIDMVEVVTFPVIGIPSLLARFFAHLPPSR
jgi:hypothetical protein